MKNPKPKDGFGALTAFPWPYEGTLAIARQIRNEFGFGGASFPGSKELYAAADKIEAWASEWEWPADE